MSWLIVMQASASHGAQQAAHSAAIAEQRRQFNMARNDQAPWRDVGITARKSAADLAELAAAHRARMEADTAKTLRDAKIGTVLILAFVVTALFGLAQLAGFV